jgi:DNA-binding FadR family transcriptional regulator
MRIMRGALKPGDTIDPDALLQDFQVSRTVMREAIKVLSAKGLVDARPRLGTYVTERSRWQLLDSDVMNWRSQDNPDPLLVLELGEVRQVIEPAAARMAAVRRTSEQLARIEAALHELESSFDATRVTPHVEADLAFHSAVLAASGNELLERFEVVLEPALHARDELAFVHETSRDFLTDHRAVFEAIAAQDPERARSTMQHLMDQAASDTEQIIAADAVGRAIQESRLRAL